MTRKLLAAALAAPPRFAAATPAQAARKGCDPIARGHCLLPFPNDFLTVRDRGVAHRPPARAAAGGDAAQQGRRADRPARVEPGRRLQPGPADHGADPRRRHRRRRAAQPARARSPTSARASRKRQRVVLIDARTGERQPIWAEVDSAAPRAGRARAPDPAGEEPARGPPLRRRAAQPAHRGRQARQADDQLPLLPRPPHDALERRRAPPAGDGADLRVAQAGRDRPPEPAARVGLHGRQPRVDSPGRCSTSATPRSRRSATRTSPISSPRAARRRSRSSRTS